MRFLSTHRRHPLAGYAVLLFGLLLAGALYYAFAPGKAEADTAGDTAKIDEGRQLFLVGCASCHGMNAEGIMTKRGGNYGPSLIGVGAAAVDFQVGTGRMPLAQTAPQAPDKPPVYDEDETEALAAYVASLAPGPAIPDEEYTDVSEISQEDLTRGGEFFRTNCTACHNSVGAGGALPSGRYAPPLRNVSARHIYEAMQTGPQQMPVFSDDVVTPEDKRAIIAYIKNVQAQPQGGFGGGGLGPVVDGMFAWIIGIGGLVAVSVWLAAHGARVKKKRS
ncbi:c-type cytochrome [Mumia zhuanghuii]|uniref:Cytochrome bc1 complex cytochrome c subunit n=1 Tax=Mumia zhuanghuii TaxID=2585211 RepID=A0A5C4ME70_9ACTN|nr:cytochrome c [Mumia zhuanghuii]TNC33025.1 c-type cytochrome [Mumia zhuanghuii]TNC36066.1 c-type cytochrome [Mumia zhuanghuii]